jgi:hypothetical protein
MDPRVGLLAVQMKIYLATVGRSVGPEFFISEWISRLATAVCDFKVQSDFVSGYGT